ncbi:MarR family winged helix-turn-helix transcriptional regulator [Microbacterium sp. cx-59]|uniref:MarR family winged helix-turn-helix transcriptional regulator n=1 Tax=Microbacterium sp. cx-59 TaxID=2891207 RepID=UPI001E29B7FF|nr:MarR family winged helix-turn-helix transcriptional regulator [Microbacterium sp. cx-59]MCC4907438.1 MarR family winged helix-turn-helix transcriptional regulator [Microbacterium sp. cx-59]
MSSFATSLPVDAAIPASVPVLEALSALQTSNALLRFRLRDQLNVRANEIVALEFIARLEALGQPVRAIDVARNLGLTNGASSLIVARMIERGFVTRTENPHDGRGHHLHLTAQVSQQITAAIGPSSADVRTLISGLSPRESRRIVTLLAAVTGSLDRGGLVPA